MESNEKQKKVTDEYRNNWDTIFKKEKKVDDLKEYQKQAQELWFKGGSCTGGSPE
jgi:pyruvate formate-lyase activating enzyme-like uncharacterized protein